MIENYEKYLAFISERLTGFFEKQSTYIKCKEGCARCCKNAEFPYSRVEMKYLLSGFLTLDKEVQDIVEQQLLKTADLKKEFKGEKFLYDCPFLVNNSCSVYKYRGVVCRTFGLIENAEEGKSKAPFCAFEGLNYSQIVDVEKRILSLEKYDKLGLTQEPLGFNIGYSFLTHSDFERKFNFEFGEKKPLIEWFL